MMVMVMTLMTKWFWLTTVTGWPPEKTTDGLCAQCSTPNPYHDDDADEYDDDDDDDEGDGGDDDKSRRKI